MKKFIPALLFLIMLSVPFHCHAQPGGSMGFSPPATVTKEVVFTLDTDPYADGDVMSETGTGEITNAVRANGSGCIIQNITCVDADDQGIAFDVYFLQTDVDLGTVNDAISISDANAKEILVPVPMTVVNAKNLINSYLFAETALGLAVEAASDSTSLFVALVSRGAGTYTASGISCTFGILQD